MGYFNFFGDNEHRVFNYKPIYYDPQEEERKRKFGAVDGSLEKGYIQEAGTLFVDADTVDEYLENGTITSVTNEDFQ